MPVILIVFEDHVALTPAGKPFAPETPSLAIPVAPVVVCVIAVKTVLTHNVGVEDGKLTVFIAKIGLTKVQVLNKFDELTIGVFKVFDVVLKPAGFPIAAASVQTLNVVLNLSAPICVSSITFGVAYSASK